MKPMTDGERQVLIHLADEFPLLEEGIRRILHRDNDHRAKLVSARAKRNYTGWRDNEIKWVVRRRKWAARLGPPLTIVSCLALARVIWLTVTESGGGWLGLVVWGLLAMIAGGMWISKYDPLELPPAYDEILRQVPDFSKIAPRDERAAQDPRGN